MSIQNNYPIGCSDEEIYATIKEYQEAIKGNPGTTVIVQRATAIIQIGEAELAVRLSREHSKITRELKTTIVKFDKKSSQYSKKLISLTEWLILFTIVMIIAIGFQIYLSAK